MATKQTLMGMEDKRQKQSEKGSWPCTYVPLIANTVLLISRVALTWEHREQVLLGQSATCDGITDTEALATAPTPRYVASVERTATAMLSVAAQ